MDLDSLIKNLDANQKMELARLLDRELNIPIIAQLAGEIRKDRPVSCPNCAGVDILGHGRYRGRKRYKCRSCKRTFNDLTGTAVDGIKKVEEFQEYLALVVESVSIRKAANKIGVNMKTIFDWRHKLLSCLSILNGEEFSGIVECDDKQPDNNKGDRDLDRKPYKRASDRQTKRGVSNDKISVMVATDRKSNPVMRVAKVGRIDAQSIQGTIGKLTGKDNVICSDSHPSIIKWAKDNELEHHTFIASRHIKGQCYHVQHVNSIDNLYERWIKPFYGVSTKYLEGYLSRFVFLQKIKKSRTQVLDLAKVVAGNIKAIQEYQTIDENYLKLDIPQYSTIFYNITKIKKHTGFS